MASAQDGSAEVESRSGDPKLSRATIVKRKDFTDDLFVLWMEPEGQFPFEPASFCMWGSQPDIAEFRSKEAAPVKAA